MAKKRLLALMGGTKKVTYFFDDFTRVDGSLGTDWVGDTFAISSNKAVGTPTGTELISNGTFTDWTGSTPTGFTITNSSPPNREVTQVAPTSGHGEGGTGAANLYTDSTTYIRINKALTVNTNKFHHQKIDVTNVVAGSLSSPFTLTEVGSYIRTGTPASTVYIRTSTSGAADITVDNLSIIELDLASQIATKKYSHNNRYGVRARVLVPNYMIGGVCVVDDPVNPQNGLFAYYYGNPAGTNALLKFIKLVDGVITELHSGTFNDLTTVEQELQIIRELNNYTVRLKHIDKGTYEVTDAAISSCQYFGLFTSHETVAFTDFTVYTIPEITSSFGLQNDWITAGAELTTMEEHPSVTNPVIDKDDITDWDDTCIFVADPFVVKDGSTYYMFFEVAAAAKTEIGYATSADGLAWTYQGIIFALGKTTFVGMSYPYVFKSGGYWWMIPDMQLSRVELWKATVFPTQWEYVKTLFSPFTHRDATIFKWGSNWYAITRNYITEAVHLYWCATLTGTWAEHPSSPIVAAGETNNRAAGRPIIRATTIDFFLQDNVAHYGDKVRVFTITALSPTEFTWAEHASSPILEESGAGWMQTGMHHIDRIDGGLAIVDGLSGSEYSIGVMRDTVP